MLRCASLTLMPELRPKWEQFAQSYVRSKFSVKAAAEAAGIKMRWAYELLEKPELRERVSELLAAGAKALIIEAGVIRREIAIIAMSDITEVLGCNTLDDLQSLPPEVRRTIKKVRQRRWIHAYAGDKPMWTETLELEMHSKMDALKLLSAIEGMVSPDKQGDEKLYFAGVSVTMLPPPERNDS